MTLTKADLVQKVYLLHENMTKQQAIDAVEVGLYLKDGKIITGHRDKGVTVTKLNPEKIEVIDMKRPAGEGGSARTYEMQSEILLYKLQLAFAKKDLDNDV